MILAGLVNYHNPASLGTVVSTLHLALPLADGRVIALAEAGVGPVAGVEPAVPAYDPVVDWGAKSPPDLEAEFVLE